jgi:hypothetical protein
LENIALHLPAKVLSILSLKQATLLRQPVAASKKERPVLGRSR